MIKLMLILFIVGLQPKTTQSVSAFRDNADLRIHYKYMHMKDLQKPEEIWEENMLLLVGAKSSIYLSYDKLRERTRNKKAAEDHYTVFVEGMAPYRISFSKNWTPTEYIRVFDNNEFYIQEYLARYFWYKEPIDDAKWSLKSERKVILGYNCKLAEASFRGRKWRVWYAEDIAVSSGPWKLGGLPGLILEASDESGQVSMIASAIEGSQIDDENITYDKNYNIIRLHEYNRAKQVTKTELDRLRVQAVKDVKMFVEIQDKEMPHSQGGVQDFGLSTRQSVKLPPPNPIDLTSKR